MRTDLPPTDRPAPHFGGKSRGIKLVIWLLILSCLSVTTAWGQKADTTPPTAEPPAQSTQPQPKGHPLDGVAGVPIKMSYHPLLTKYPILYLRINGGEPRPFLFDTGFSGTLLINDAEAKKMGLKITESKVINVDAMGVKEKLKNATVDSVRGMMTNGYSFSIQEPLVFVSTIDFGEPNSEPCPAVGVVGLRLFPDATWYFDFETQEVLLIQANHPDVASLADTFSIPITYSKGLIRMDAQDIWGKKEPIILDTGASDSSFSAKLINHLKPSASFDSAEVGAFRFAVPTTVRYVEKIPLGKWELKNFVFRETRKREPVLGMDILSRFRVTIDTRRKKMVLEPTTMGVAMGERVAGHSGILLARRDKDIFIYDAIDKYKDIIGATLIAVADKDVEISASTIAGKPLALVQAVLDGYGGTETKITVRRLGEDKTVTIRRIMPSEMQKVLRPLRERHTAKSE